MNIEDIYAALEQGEMTPQRKLALKLRGNVSQVPIPAPKALVEPNRTLGGVPAVPNRPDIQGLYDEMGTLSGEKLDFGKLDQLNQANESAGKSNFAKSLAMQMFGGKRMEAPGRMLMQDSMERSKPIRPNAADIGWTNQETGEFVQNPVMERNQKEKVIAGRIDALVKEQERKAAILVSQGQLAAAEAASRNAEQLKLMMLGIQQGNQALTAALTTAKINKLEGNLGDTKPLVSKDVDVLTDMSKMYTNLTNAHAGFKDEYSPQTYAGKPGVIAENWVEQNFPKVSSKIGSKKDQERVTGQAQWWKENEYFNTLPERHAMFGATLTAGEKEAWAAASIQPGMRPESIKANMAKRKEIMESAARRMHDTHIANKRIPAAVRAGLSAFSPEILGVGQDEIDQELARRGAPQ